MFRSHKHSLIALAVIAAAAFGALFALPPAFAATTNYSLATPVYVIPIQISKQWTTTTTNVVRFAIPFKARLVGVSASARASGGTTPTLTVDVLKGGVTVLSAPIAVTAGAVAEGTVTVPTLEDESVITMTLTIGGTTPTWDDITVLLTVVRN